MTSSLAVADVCAVSLVSFDEPNRILIGVRRSSTNESFPNAMSVPTQRVPSSLLEEISANVHLQVDEGSNHEFESIWVSSSRSSGHDPLIFLIDSILARKLHLSDALESGEFKYEATLATITTAWVDQLRAAGPAMPELTRMANVIVSVTSGASLIPEETASYSRICWRPQRDVLEAIHTNDALIAWPDGDPFELCVKGLCLATTADLIERGRLEI